jgi:hypothetical protein
MNPAMLDLRDIHLPPEPSWWPPAPGWWLLAVLAIAVLAGLLRAWQRQRWLQRERRHLREVLATLRAVHAQDGAALLAACSELLRRACKRHAPWALALQGQAWLDFLDQGLDGRPFGDGPGRLLLDGPYMRTIEPAAADHVARLVEQRLQHLPGARR